MQTTQTPTNFLSRATSLVDRGFSVIPLEPRGKKPVGLGTTSRTNNIEIVKAWASQFPEGANVGVCSDENITILESDDAKQLRAKLTDMGVTLPETLTGGASENRPHWFFKRPANCGDDCVTVPGLFEWRHRNQYVVGPGSIHPNGSEYRFWNDAPIVELPADVISALRGLAAGYSGEAKSEHIQPGPYVALRAAYLQRLDPAGLLGIDGIEVSEGERHYLLMSLAGLLHDGERSAEDIAEILTQVQDEYFAEGKSEYEISSIAGYAVRREPAVIEPRELPTFAIGTKVFNSAEAKAEYAAKHPEEVKAAEEKAAAQKPESLLKGEPREFNPWEYALQPLPDQKFSGWFPRGRFAIVSGSSGAMKSSFLIQALAAARDGESFLGHGAGKLAFKIMFADRGKWDVEETLQRMHLADKVPFECINGIGQDASLKAISRAAKEYPVVVIDGGDLLVEDNNDGASVGNLTGVLQRIAEHYGTAFIVTTGSGKGSAKALKDGAERRSIVKGSEVWSRTGGTVFTLNSEHDGTLDSRRLVVQHRNAPTEKFLLRLENGRLVPVDEVAEQATSDNKAMLKWVMDQDRFTLATFRKALGTSGETGRKRLEGLVSSGLLGKLERGERTFYVVNRGE